VKIFCFYVCYYDDAYAFGFVIEFYVCGTSCHTCSVIILCTFSLLCGLSDLKCV